MRQNSCTVGFNTSSSWIILSPIEQSIKHKIESIGTPLKDWDINIYRGILTGYNEAFIISTEKRNEILANCKTEDEKMRTADLIRPILRGRDIKRYSYVWNDLWLIATFPSRHYNIDDYPAVKSHLLSFGKERLEQSGKKHKINGEEVKARKKTNNKWFETQDSISYWEDFSKPVIAWQRITSKNQFCLTKSGTIILDSMAFLSNLGEKANYLMGILNSTLVYFWIKKNVHEYGDTGFRLSNQYVELIPVPTKINQEINDLVQQELDIHSDKLIKEIDLKIYKLYDLSDEEINYIES